MDFNILLLFTITSVALTLFPGPDILFVFSTSLTKGWKKGILVSLGLTSGLWIHTLLVILGVGNLLTQYPKSQRLLEFLGGFYLLYLAFRLLRSYKLESKKKKINLTLPKKQHFFLSGFVMNLTNPKVSLFFISFFPGFLFNDSWTYSFQFLILGTLFFLQALTIFSIVSIFSSQMGKIIIFKERTIIWNRFQVLVLAIIALILIYP